MALFRTALTSFGSGLLFWARAASGARTAAPTARIVSRPSSRAGLMRASPFSGKRDKAIVAFLSPAVVIYCPAGRRTADLPAARTAMAIPGVSQSVSCGQAPVFPRFAHDVLPVPIAPNGRVPVLL